MGAHLRLIVCTRIPEQLLRQQLNWTDDGTLTAANAGLLVAERIGIGQD